MPAPVQLSRLPASLIAILALAGALRLLGITSPLLDNHRWRQVDTAAIARNLYLGDMNILYPEIDWGGHAGYVECEFPLVPFIVAIGYQIFGVHEWFGRVVSLAFSLGTVATVYRLGTLTLGAPAGRAAAFLFAISPSAVYYGRTFMPDAAMVFFSAAAVLASIEYHRHGRRRDLISMAICLPLACLVKLPAVIVIPVIFAAAFEHRGRAAFREKATAVAVLVALAATAAWYAHAAHLYEQTGLTFGIFHPTKAYPPEISPGPWETALSKWDTWQLLSGRMFWERLFARLYFLHLLPWGLAGAVVGALLWTGRTGSLTVWSWFGAAFVFTVAAARGNLAHDYYQLPLLPPAALLFGAAAAPLFDEEWIRKRLGGGWWAGASVCTAVLTVSLLSFYYSGVLRTHFRFDSLDLPTWHAGRAIERATRARSLAVVVDDYGVNSPLLLYYANLKGWSFDVDQMTPTVLATLRGRGAVYFATTVWPRIVRERADTAAVLDGFPRVRIDRAPSGTVLFDLTRTLESPPGLPSERRGTRPAGSQARENPREPARAPE